MHVTPSGYESLAEACEQAGMDGELIALLRQGRCCLLVARASGEKGQNPVRLAAADALDGFDVLFDMTGIDLSPWAATEEAIVAALKAAPVTPATDEDGRRFTNTHVLFDRRDVGFVLLVSSGSGSKLDADGHQPFITLLAQTMKQLNPALVFGKKFSRLGRVNWEFAPAARAGERIGCFIGAEDEPIAKMSFENSERLFQRVTDSRRQAIEILKSTRRGMRRKTGRELVDGRCDYAIAEAPPPGLGIATLRDGVSVGRQILYLDTDGCRPEADEVVFGLPDLWVDGDRTQRVDQVENVRFLLKHYGRDDWPDWKLKAALDRKKFSSHGIRVECKSAEATYTGSSVATALSAVLRNLPVYRMQILPITFSVPGVRDIQISNIVPPDGAWADVADFERIEWRMGLGTKYAAGRQSATFAGLKVTVNGHEATLRSGPKKRTYTFDFTPGKSGPTAAVSPTHDFIAGLIIDGVTRVEGLALGEVVQVPLTTAANEALVAAQDALAEADRQRASKWEELEARDENNKLVAVGDYRSKLVAQYNSLEAKWNSTAAALAQCEAAMSEPVSVGNGTGAPKVADLAMMLATLPDMKSREWTPRWRDGLELSFESKRLRSGNHVGRVLDAVGVLRIADDDEGDEVEIPLRKRQELGAMFRIESTVDGILSRLREGVPLRHLEGVDVRPNFEPLAQRLGEDVHSFPLRSIDDPRIVRTLMAVKYGGGRTVAKIAADLGEDQGFVARVASVHRRWTSQKWLLQKERVSHRIAMLAIQNGGVVTASRAAVAGIPSLRHSIYKARRQFDRIADDTWRLLPCPHGCKVIARARLRIPEAVGWLCLECRRDEAGLPWDSTYDRYLTDPQLWTSVRPEILVPATAAGKAPSKRRGPCKEIVGLDVRLSYEQGATLAELAAEYGSTATTIRKAIVREGGTIRSTGPNLGRIAHGDVPAMPLVAASRTARSKRLNTLGGTGSGVAVQDTGVRPTGDVV